MNWTQNVLQTLVTMIEVDRLGLFDTPEAIEQPKNTRDIPKALLKNAAKHQHELQAAGSTIQVVKLVVKINVICHAQLEAHHMILPLLQERNVTFLDYWQGFAKANETMRRDVNTVLVLKPH